MKKFLSLILATAMIFGMFTACGKADTETTESPATEETATEAATEAPNMLADKTLEEIAEAIYAQKAPLFPVMTTPVDLTDENAVRYATGLSMDDVSKVKEAVTSDAMMGSQAYSLVLLRVNDANDAETIANAVMNGIDPRKWICVEADDLRAAAHGDVVMFVMISTVFEEDITAEQLVAAFTEVAGGSVSFNLTK